MKASGAKLVQMSHERPMEVIYCLMLVLELCAYGSIVSLNPILAKYCAFSLIYGIERRSLLVVEDVSAESAIYIA